MADERGFSVFIKQRPCKVAFLVDLNLTPSDLIDAIIDFNVDSWGGRYRKAGAVSGGN